MSCTKTAGYNDVTLSFSYYNDAEENAGVELAASLYDQDNDITYNLGTVKLDASASEWRKFEANKKINSDNLRIHVKITSNNGNNIYLDEFRLDGVSSVDTILANGVSVSAENGAIRVAGLEGENVMICNLSGVLLYNDKSEGDITVPVVAGIYVVRVADRSLKVVVR